jgi:hypothetical protein
MQPSSPCATCASGRGGEELVHRAALVGLDVRERDPAQLLDRQHLGNRLAHARKQSPHAGVVKQRLVRVHEELVEREAGRADLRDVRRDAVDPRGDLVDACLHGPS